MLDRIPQVFLSYSWTSKEYLMKEEALLLLSDLQNLINQVVLIDYTIIILGYRKWNLILTKKWLAQ